MQFIYQSVVLLFFMTTISYGAQQNPTNQGQKRKFNENGLDFPKRQKGEKQSCSSSSNAEPMDTDNDQLKTKEKTGLMQKAISKQNFGKIQELIGKNPLLVDVQDLMDQNTALMQASKTGDIETIQFLIKASANPFINNKDNETAQDMTENMIEHCESVGVADSEDYVKYNEIKEMLIEHEENYAKKIANSIDEGMQKDFPGVLKNLIGEYLTKDKAQEIPKYVDDMTDNYSTWLQSQGIFKEE